MDRIMGELVEPFAVADTFVSGLAEVEDIGHGCFRLVWYSRSKHDGREELQVVAKFVMAAGEVPLAMRKMAKATNTCACEAIAVAILN